MDIWFFIAIGNAVLGALVCYWLSKTLKKDSVYLWGLVGFFFGIIPITFLVLEIKSKFGEDV
jgi:hypothetical protein